MPRIVLASRSPARKTLLHTLGLDFETMPSDVLERSIKASSPRALVRRRALLKAKDVASRSKSGIVIAADTVIVLNSNVLGKPMDSAEAREMLMQMSGKVHRVKTGLCVMNIESGELVLKSVTTKVKFRRLREDAVEKYVRTGEALGKAGAYAIQGRGAALVEWVRGCFYNVAGLPISALVGILEKMEVDVFA